MRPALVVLFCLLCVTVKSKADTLEETYGDMEGDEVQNDADDNESPNYFDREEEPVDAPEESNDTNNQITSEFLTKSQEFMAKIGDLVELPCEVTNPDSAVLVWKRNETEFLYQSDIAVQHIPNIKKTNKSLEVTVTSESDFGSYSCQMLATATNSPKITHIIKHLSPPTIHSIYTANNKTVFNIGETLDLTCNATGTPTLKISWVRDTERLEPKGKNLVIQNLKPRHAGIYRCLADNKIEPADHGFIIIQVKHKPDVFVDKYIVNSDHEKDAELACTVHAHPNAVINWQKDGVNIVKNEPKIILKRHENNMELDLLIRNLTEADFGRYTCTAKNAIGKAEKSVNLVKIPAIQGKIAPEKKNREVILTWKVESKSPIIEHQLEYRRKGGDSWKDVRPKVAANVNDTYTVRYVLTSLEPGTYEVRTRSKNAHGWSDYSETIDFEGVSAKHVSHHKPHKKPKDREQKDKSITFSSQTSPPEQHQDIEPAIQEKSVAPSTQATPARHQENDPTIGASTPTDAGASSLPSIYLHTGIVLLILFLRQ